MNLKGFLDTALSQALELGMGSADDVVRHVTPEILADHLPRPLWARLLTACLGAPRVDAQLVIETVGIANLCEHVPVAVMWNCLSEIASRSLGREFVPLDVPVSAPSAIISKVESSPVVTRQDRPAPLSLTPPPEEKPRETPAPKPVALGPSIPTPSTGSADSLADVVAALENDERAAAMPTRARTPTSQRFRQTNTNGIGRLAANNTRRPQAAAPATEPVPTVPPAAPPGRTARRGSTEVSEYESETEVGKDDWKNTLAVDVEEEQLVEWSAAGEETQSSSDEFGRKR
jgi:hypothetical protein